MFDNLIRGPNETWGFQILRLDSLCEYYIRNITSIARIKYSNIHEGYQILSINGQELKNKIQVDVDIILNNCNHLHIEYCNPTSTSHTASGIRQTNGSNMMDLSNQTTNNNSTFISLRVPNTNNVIDLVSDDEDNTEGAIVNSDIPQVSNPIIPLNVSTSAPSTLNSTPSNEKKIRKLTDDCNSKPPSSKKLKITVKLEFEPKAFGCANIEDEVIEVVNPTKDNDFSNSKDNDIELVGGNMQLAVDMPHPRDACTVFPFNKVSYIDNLSNPQNLKHCTFCYCYICDVKVSECLKWDRHCNASHNNNHCKAERDNLRKPFLMKLELTSRMEVCAIIINMDLKTPQAQLLPEYENIIRIVTSELQKEGGIGSSQEQYCVKCLILLIHGIKMTESPLRMNQDYLVKFQNLLITVCLKWTLSDAIKTLLLKELLTLIRSEFSILFHTFITSNQLISFILSIKSKPLCYRFLESCVNIGYTHLALNVLLSKPDWNNMKYKLIIQISLNLIDKGDKRGLETLESLKLTDLCKVEDLEFKTISTLSFLYFVGLSNLRLIQKKGSSAIRPLFLVVLIKGISLSITNYIKLLIKDKTTNIVLVDGQQSIVSTLVHSISQDINATCIQLFTQLPSTWRNNISFCSFGEKQYILMMIYYLRNTRYLSIQSISLLHDLDMSTLIIIAGIMTYSTSNVPSHVSYGNEILQKRILSRIVDDNISLSTIDLIDELYQTCCNMLTHWKLNDLSKLFQDISIKVQLTNSSYSCGLKECVALCRIFLHKEDSTNLGHALLIGISTYLQHDQIYDETLLESIHSSTSKYLKLLKGMEHLSLNLKSEALLLLRSFHLAYIIKITPYTSEETLLKLFRNFRDIFVVALQDTCKFSLCLHLNLNLNVFVFSDENNGSFQHVEVLED